MFMKVKASDKFRKRSPRPMVDASLTSSRSRRSGDETWSVEVYLLRDNDAMTGSEAFAIMLTMEQAKRLGQQLLDFGTRS